MFDIRKVTVHLFEVVDAVKATYYGTAKGSPEREINYKIAKKLLVKYNYEWEKKVSLKDVRSLIHHLAKKKKDEIAADQEALAKALER